MALQQSVSVDVDTEKLKIAGRYNDTCVNEGDNKSSGDHMKSIIDVIGIKTGNEQQKIIRPKFHYSKEQLYALSQTPYSRRRPLFLDPAYYNECDVWDPERWAASIQEKPTHSSQDEFRAKRPSDFDREMPGKRRPADPRDRVREEQDGIILSPQRRSFGTGCYVTRQSGGGNRRPDSPMDVRGSDRDSHTDLNRRIVNSRIVPRDRDRDYGFRNASDRRDRERFDRDERDNRFSRERVNKERDLDRHGNRDRGYRRVEEQEPEWFSGGPTSQSETIELKGFDEGHEAPASRVHERPEREAVRRDRKKSWRRQKTPSGEDVSDKSEAYSEAVVDNHSRSSPQSACGNTKQANRVKDDNENVVGEADATTTDFDFNELFNMEAIPGFFMPNAAPANNYSGLTGSKFGQFFQHREASPMHDHSSGTSRRSSFQDELIAPIMSSLSGRDSSVPSPSSRPNSYFAPISPAQQTEASSRALMEMLQPNNRVGLENFTDSLVSDKNLVSVPSKPASVQELEAGLKSLLLVNKENYNNATAITHKKQSGDDTNAFEKLLFRISDGKITPASSQIFSLGQIDSSKVLQEKDILQSGSSLASQTSCNAHHANVLKNAPTEQDILAALDRPFVGNRSSVHSVTGPKETLQNNNSNNPLAKLLISHNKSGVSDVGMSGVDGNRCLSSSAGRLNESLGMHMDVRENNVGHNVLMSTQSASDIIQQRQREILAAILQQQQQQQVAQPQPLPSMPPPVIQRPPSPPSHLTHMMNGPATSNSPVLHHGDSSLTLLPQGAPRIPSPLVFGQTPPVINHAPSPIHPAQMSQSMSSSGSSLNPNTLQVHATHVMARVPSPQELRAHTQQIMQNALIKKKLEEQKENYRKRQEMQGSRSPSITKVDTYSNHSSFNGGPSLGKGTSGLGNSFTPTAVMRKMQVGKEKEAKLNCQASQSSQLSVHGQMNVDKVPSTSAVGTSHVDFQDFQALSCPRPLQRLSSNGPMSCASMLPVPPAQHNHLPLQGRRIVKSNQGGGSHISRVSNPVAFLGNQNNAFLPNDVMKQLRLQQQVTQCQSGLASVPSTVLGNGAVPLRGSASSLGPLRTGANVNATGYPVRNVIPPVASLNQLAAFHPRVMDPCQLPSAPSQLVHPHHGVHPFSVQQLFFGMSNAAAAAAAAAAAGRQAMPLAPSGQHPMTGKPDSAFSGVGVSGNSSMSARSSSPSNNLAKWFNTDVLKQKMTDLPPVPLQEAQYVEDVEQRQQQTVQN